ncbi:class I SAM-dependent methyltransferase [Mycobacterium sp. Y57]|uniref:phthiotriol/phenolphthiotriol dimycocerosates methyltransferase n=1 Tax=Mycolicibacterium xanthum TaxID=2796469 RepID=UPI001C842ECF|nr:class I SAM-dependent methyltransferase [Mycolicibacterium xanthum]
MAFVGMTHRHFGKQVSSLGYRFLTRRIGTDEVHFLNWGYEEEPPMGIPLDPADEIDRYSIQLYHRTAAQVDLTGKDVLEVSCGHGGAASYIMRTLGPASYTGLDLNPAGIEYCRDKHRLPGLSFVHGDAENLPFPDESFDAVVNVEAAHLYPHFDKFLEEVARVLRPGGSFLYADLRDQKHIAEWEAALAAAPLRMVAQEAIDAQVLRGLEKNSKRHTELIAKHAPKGLRQLSRDIGGVQGDRLYRQVESGDISYRVYLFTKD